jgi:hypothetical protein
MPDPLTPEDVAARYRECWPPHPDRDGWYWLQHGYGGWRVARWHKAGAWTFDGEREFWRPAALARVNPWTVWAEVPEPSTLPGYFWLGAEAGSADA